MSASTKLPVLVVDDNEDSAAMMAKLLSALGVTADVANSGVTALQRVERKHYGVAILDYQMPGMNGLELFRQIREIQPDLCGIFLTGYTTIDVVFPAIEAGVLRVLSKPVDFEELVPIIEEHLVSRA
jgi:CheY-like chemotaxis protein